VAPTAPPLRLRDRAGREESTAARPGAPHSGEQQHALGHGTAPATFIARIITDMRDGGIIATGTIAVGTAAGG